LAKVPRDASQGSEFIEQGKKRGKRNLEASHIQMAYRGADLRPTKKRLKKKEGEEKACYGGLAILRN